MSTPSETDSGEAAAFAQLVMQLANMAILTMGKVPHPETGKATRDLAAAQMFISQLEMLETKTRGNLAAEESAFLKNTLMSLHMAFVESSKETPPANPPS
jgi:hypothetical protein